MIPFNIVTYYHDLTNFPENMKNNYNQLVNDHPDFICNIYDNNSAYEFINNHFDKKIAYAFLKLKPYSYKSDLFRFCYLYIMGGIYVDIKYQCVKDFRFEQLTDKEYLVSEPLGVQTCLLILHPRNHLMIECINEITRKTENNYYGTTPLWTGPYLLSEKYKILYKDNQINKELSWINNGKQHINLNGIDILQEYSAYRDDLSINSDQPHYTDMFWNKDIYNNL